MTIYPNREHENADRAAMRRALHALDGIDGEVRDLRLKLSRGSHVDADEAQVITGHVRALIGYLAELGTLRDVRKWHEADQIIKVNNLGGQDPFPRFGADENDLDEER